MYVYIIRELDGEIFGVHSSYASAHDWLLNEGYQYDDMEKMYWRNGAECVVFAYEVECYQPKDKLISTDNVWADSFANSLEQALHGFGFKSR